MSGLRVTTAAARDQSVADALEARRPKIVRQPRWVVAPHKSERGTWLFTNVSEGTRARDVTLDAPVSEFTFMGSADWDEIAGEGMKTFRGYPTEGGAHFGVDFYTEWTDDGDERQSASVRWQRPTGYSGLL